MKHLKVALIGGGFMGKAHSYAYDLARVTGGPGGVVVDKEVLVDADAAIAAASAQELGWASSATDWREVISRSDIDIVDICTPPQFHKEIAIAALAAGKHVFCEKPIANSLRDAEQMREAAQRAGVVAQVGFNYRHTPAIEYLKQLLADGELGEPLQFRASFLQDGGFNANPNRWRAKRSTGGSGAIGDVGSHLIDTAQYFFGPIARVTATARSYGTSAWMSASERAELDALDDSGYWIAEFESGTIGTFTVSTVSSGRKNGFHFEFDATKAAVEFDWNSREEFRISYVDDPPQQQGFKTVRTYEVHPDGWWKLAGLGMGYVEVSAIQFEKFIAAVLGKSPAQLDFTHGAQVQAVVEAVLESIETGQWADVPSIRAGMSDRSLA